MCKMKAFRELCTLSPDLPRMVSEALKVAAPGGFMSSLTPEGWHPAAPFPVSTPCPMPTPLLQSHPDCPGGKTHPHFFCSVAQASGCHHEELGPAQGNGIAEGMAELAPSLASHARAPLLQSGTTEWFHMKKQHLKPMVKVSPHLGLSAKERSNLLGRGRRPRGGMMRPERRLLQFFDLSRCLGLQQVLVSWCFKLETQILPA